MGRNICLAKFYGIRQVGLGYGLTFERSNFAAFDATSAWAMGYMVIFSMAICTLAWFAALRRLPPAAASTSMLLVRVTGIISASLPGRTAWRAGSAGDDPYPPGCCPRVAELLNGSVGSTR